MSLINDMLKNLDKQKKQPTPAYAENPNLSTKEIHILEGIQTPMAITKKPKILLGLLGLLGITILILAFIVVTYFAKTIQIIKKPEFIKTNSSLGKTFSDVVIKPAAHIRNFIFNANDKIGTLNILLSQPAYYHINQSIDHKNLNLTILGAELNKNLNQIKQNDWIKDIKMTQSQSGEDAEINIALTEQSKMQKVKFINQAQPILQITFLKSENPQIISPQISKNLIPLTPQQQAQQFYQNALQLLQKNNISGAISTLRAALQKETDNIPARELLTTLLLKRGLLSDANAVVIKGLMENPDNLTLIQLRAHILFKQNKIGNALSILRQHAPEMWQQPNYYAFMAALYQRQGQYIQAASIYNQLVKLHDFPMWWVGLGIALDSAGKNNAAIEAYSNALKSTATIDPQVKDFVENKLNILKGTT